MRTAKLDEIVRQRDAALKQVVEQLAKSQVGEAVQGLERQGRVHEVANQSERIAAIAKEYARQPENTLVVSPDNHSRAEINQAIRTELQGTGVVCREERTAPAFLCPGRTLPEQIGPGPSATTSTTCCAYLQDLQDARGHDWTDENFRRLDAFAQSKNPDLKSY